MFCLLSGFLHLHNYFQLIHAVFLDQHFIHKDILF